MSVTWLDPDPGSAFPPVSAALQEPNGLLAAGGDLTAQRLVNAYRHGIFPWYEDEQPILWWSPDPRAVFFPDEFHVSRSLRRRLRRPGLELSFDEAFGDVVEHCADARPGQGGTWITDEMHAAYVAFHDQGHAHSVEVWQDDVLVGGLYGVAIGRVFFAESMFHTVTDASKVALARLVGQLARWSFGLVDCQIVNPHLQSLGSREITRAEYCRLLDTYCDKDGPLTWQFDDDLAATGVPGRSSETA